MDLGLDILGLCTGGTRSFRVPWLLALVARLELCTHHKSRDWQGKCGEKIEKGAIRLGTSSDGMGDYTIVA